MNIGEKIVKARKEKGMTQAELGSELHVTFQAVSKWERGESSPDFETICNMAKILEVPVSYFENSDEKEDEAKDEIKEENKEEKETKEEVATTVVYEQPKPVLAVCEKCNRPIYNGSEIIRYDVGRVICRECRDREKKRRFQEAVEKGKKNRIKSFVISGILFVVFLMLAIANGGKDIGYGIASAVMIFTFSSCLILNNNCIADVFGWITQLGFVKFPGLIFSLDLDGILWFICVKLLFWVLGILITLFFMVVAFVICSIISLFVYPFAIVKNFKTPEKGDYSSL